MAAPAVPLPGRYRFRAGHGALAIVNASCIKQNGAWVAEPGHVASLTLLREQLIACGFAPIGELGLGAPAGPTADEVRSFIDNLSQRSFEEYDAFLLVIAAHGREGSIVAWPNPGETVKSGPPIQLQEEVFRSFQLAAAVPGSSGMADSTAAARTLVGKPKLFLVDACRSPDPTDPTASQVGPLSNPLSAAQAQPPQSRVFDLLRKKDWYEAVTGPDGGLATRHSDFCVCYSTVSLNQAGVLDSGSCFLTPVAEQLRDFPELSYTEQLHAANFEMARRHSHSGRVAQTTYPQTAQVVETLTRVLHFYLPPNDTPEASLRAMTDIILA